MKIKTLFILITVLYFLSHYGYTDEWTLNRTVNAALEVSNQIAIEVLEAGEANLDVITSEKKWLPMLSFSAGVNYVSEVMEIEMPLKTIRFGDYDSYELNVMFNQLLYDGGQLKALKEAGEKRLMMSLQNAEAVGLAVEFQAKVSFFTVVMAENSVETARQSLIEANKHFNDVSALYSQGMVLENDVLRAKLRISNAEMELVSRKADLERAKAAFRKVTSIDSNEEVIVKWEDDNIKNMEMENVERAFELRPEFKAFDAAIGASEESVKAARAGILPKVGLFGGFTYGKPGIDMPSNKWMHYLRGGVNLNWNLWDWGLTTYEVDKAYISKEKLIKKRDDFKLVISQQLSEAFAGYEEAKEREKLAIESSEFAEKQLELTQSAYREGMATETDYDSAHTAFTKAVYMKTNARAALWLSVANLEYVMGIRYSGGEK